MSPQRILLITITAGISATLSGVGLARFAYTALLPELIHAQWFNESAAALLGATNLIGYALGAVFAAKLCGCWGATRVLRWASAAVFVTFIASAWPTPLVIYGVFRFVSGLAGGALMATAPPVILTRVGKANQRFASACIFIGIGLGIVLSALIYLQASQLSLNLVWLLLVVVSFLPFAFLQWVWPGEQDEAPHTKNPSTSKPEKPTMSVYQKRSLFILLLAYALDATGYIPHTVFWVDYLNRYVGFSSAQSAFQWGIFGLGALLSPFFIGWLASRVGWQWTLLFAFSAKALAIFIPVLSHQLLLISCSSFVVGAMVPGIVAAMSGRLMELYGKTHQVKVWGLATATFAVTQGIAAYGFAILYTSENGPYWSFLLGASVLWVAVALLSTGWRSFDEARCEISHYITGYYSRLRPHTFNNGLTPVATEAMFEIAS